MKRKSRILIDCDGILSDFVAHALGLVYTHTGDKHTHAEIVQWDVFKAIGKKHLEHILNDAVTKGGWCETMPMLPGAKEAVAKLSEMGQIFVVTSPFDAPSWVFERTRWLERHFGINKKQVVNTASKFVVAGDILIDDSEKNLAEWREDRLLWGDSNPLALLWDSPWNQPVDSNAEQLKQVNRVHDWDTLIKVAKDHLK